MAISKDGDAIATASVGSEGAAGIDNHAMGTVFEELVRKFNEENNEEAGEHWTPRDAVRLMAN
jgi:type I restriction enzyme M protein